MDKFSLLNIIASTAIFVTLLLEILQETKIYKILNRLSNDFKAIIMKTIIKLFFFTFVSCNIQKGTYYITDFGAKGDGKTSNDGINMTNSRNVCITNCDFRTGDDAIIVSGTEDEIDTNNQKTNKKSALQLYGNKTCNYENIVISNCLLQSRSAGIRIS